jgi:hypothetical protein
MFIRKDQPFAIPQIALFLRLCELFRIHIEMGIFIDSATNHGYYLGSSVVVT